MENKYRQKEEKLKQLYDKKIQKLEQEKQVCSSKIEEKNQDIYNLRLEMDIKLEKIRYKDLHSSWIKYCKTPSFILKEKEYLKKEKLKQLKEENEKINSVLTEKDSNNKFENARDYLDYFRDKRSNKPLFKLATVSDLLLAFFRNVTTILFLTLATQYFYYKSSWINFTFLVITLVISILGNTWQFTVNLSDKIESRDKWIDNIFAIVVMSFIFSLSIVWKQAEGTVKSIIDTEQKTCRYQDFKNSKQNQLQIACTLYQYEYEETIYSHNKEQRPLQKVGANFKLANEREILITLDNNNEQKNSITLNELPAQKVIDNGWTCLQSIQEKLCFK